MKQLGKDLAPLWAFLTIVATALFLAGCGEFSTALSGPQEVKLPDGRTVVCMLGESGSVDCDWAHAK